MNKLDNFRKMIIIIIFILYLIYSYFVNKITQTIGENHYDDDHRVYDICHKFLPNCEKYEFIGNIYIGLIILLVLCKPSKIITILFDLLSFIIPIYFVRSILTLITVLPKSSHCEYNSAFAFINGGCYDKIFSGHAAIVFILTLLLQRNKIINLASLILLNTINIIIILLTRTHYTIDIIVSFLVCYIMYTNNIRL